MEGVQNKLLSDGLIFINPSDPSVIMWLHSECSAPYRPNLPFLISLSAQMSEI